MATPPGLPDRPRGPCAPADPRQALCRGRGERLQPADPRSVRLRPLEPHMEARAPDAGGPKPRRQRGAERKALRRRRSPGAGGREPAGGRALQPGVRALADLGPLNTPTSGAAAAVARDEVVVFGGEKQDGSGDTVAATEAYDPATGAGPTWPTCSRLGTGWVARRLETASSRSRAGRSAASLLRRQRVPAGSVAAPRTRPGAARISRRRGNRIQRIPQRGSASGGPGAFARSSPRSRARRWSAGR